MKHIKEGKVIVNLINVVFLQGELNGMYKHIDFTSLNIISRFKDMTVIKLSVKTIVLGCLFFFFSF